MGFQLPDNIWPLLSNPLILVGFVVFICVGVIKLVVNPNFLPQVTSSDAGRIIQRLLSYLFWIAIVAVVLGFGIQFYQMYLDRNGVNQKDSSSAFPFYDIAHDTSISFIENRLGPPEYFQNEIPKFRIYDDEGSKLLLLIGESSNNVEDISAKAYFGTASNLEVRNYQGNPLGVMTSVVVTDFLQPPFEDGGIYCGPIVQIPHVFMGRTEAEFARVTCGSLSLSSGWRKWGVLVSMADVPNGEMSAFEQATLFDKVRCLSAGVMEFEPDDCVEVREVDEPEFAYQVIDVLHQAPIKGIYECSLGSLIDDEAKSKEFFGDWDDQVYDPSHYNSEPYDSACAVLDHVILSQVNRLGL